MGVRVFCGRSERQLPRRARGAALTPTGPAAKPTIRRRGRSGIGWPGSCSAAWPGGSPTRNAVLAADGDVGEGSRAPLGLQTGPSPRWPFPWPWWARSLPHVVPATACRRPAPARRLIDQRGEGGGGADFLRSARSRRRPGRWPDRLGEQPGLDARRLDAAAAPGAGSRWPATFAAVASGRLGDRGGCCGDHCPGGADPHHRDRAILAQPVGVT